MARKDAVGRKTDRVTERAPFVRRRLLETALRQNFAARLKKAPFAGKKGRFPAKKQKTNLERAEHSAFSLPTAQKRAVPLLRFAARKSG